MPFENSVSHHTPGVKLLHCRSPFCLCLEHVQQLGAYRIPRRPAFSSHLLGWLHSQERLFGFSLSAVFIASLRRSPSVLRPTSKTGCQVPTMVLSEARGL